jgi:1-acyl-sn-glycerol-3-phosphate acyltransferase
MLPKPEKTFARLMLWPFWVVVYWIYLVVFGLLAMIVNLSCLLTSFLPKGNWRYSFYQKMIGGMSRSSIWLLRVVGILRVQHVGFEQIETSESAQKAILVANHPSLFDVFLFYAALPKLTCIYKAGVRKTLIKNTMGEQIGFISNANPKHMILEGAQRIAAGEQLLIFPEGTRTESGHLNPLKSGAAGIARRAGVGLRAVVIHSGSLNCLSKHQALWKPPVLPIFIRVEVGEEFHVRDYETSQELNRALAAYFEAELRQERVV